MTSIHWLPHLPSACVDPFSLPHTAYRLSSSLASLVSRLPDVARLPPSLA